VTKGLRDEETGEKGKIGRIEGWKDGIMEEWV